MLKTTKRTFGDETYETTTLPATAGLELFVSLARHLRGAALFFGALRDGGEAADAAISRAFMGALEGVDPRALSADVFALLDGLVLVGPKARVTLDRAALGVHFAGRITTLARVAVWVAEVNYPDFFDLLRNARASAASSGSEGRAQSAPTVG